MSKTHPLSCVEQYDLRTDSWTRIAHMEISRYGLATCFYDGHLYASGGYNDTLGYLNSVECYSLREDKWKNVAPMNTCTKKVRNNQHVVPRAATHNLASACKNSA
jgi:hypothetical protein